ncbi:ABC transporter permease [Wenzhouxiangella sp. XN79A]|uniref:MlaE family ABC transporter permease n=1 Tax=Wenzhouxiangella sp. XN79A TaxID=2724193 RepID=UPI00144A7DC5|nr:ABC transporter permease [Wenzhouxiangella sp. XN79A]NKI33700.1 ABC transporter permease [Wenzhouxiangella sp. XN79A]
MPAEAHTERGPGLRRAQGDDGDRIEAFGDWTLLHAITLADQVERTGSRAARLDFRGITRLDASGALLLERLTERRGQTARDAGLPERWQRVFEAVDQACDDRPADDPPDEPAWRQVLERIGRATVEIATSTRELFGFLGLTLHRLVRTLLQPKRLRLTSVVHHIEQTGLDAVPLLILLAALVGAVIAFLGATVLADFGAELFVVDLVAFAFAREFGVLLTAILLAGRTASAFCAQIGMMKSREEIDAIRILGLDTVEVLVLPRLIALLIALPLLTFLATLAGLFGGLVVSVVSLDINLSLYIERVEQTLTLRQYLIGMIKAPIFALVIALIGCLEGLRVSGTAQSVGEHTTTAVVRSITMVIVIDALAAIYFMEIGW